ncbi:MAG: extracellular solute-binding protein [Clostridia bacterium]|nr:extracellular solute-binding protein [Clostridia bacterium]
MKKMLTALMALILVLAMAGSAVAEFELPIVEEPVTLTVFMETDVKWSATKNSVAEVGSYQTIMEKTGVNLEFNHPAAGQQADQFNLMIASNNLPDIIYYNWASVSGGPAKYIEDGTILALNDYLEEWAPNFLAYMEKYPDIRKQTVLDDGTYYMLPMIRLDEETGAGTWFKTAGFMIRQDWLTALDLEMPTTISELHDVLVAFRDNDPNGNGEADEIPFATTKDYGIAQFAGAFGILDDFYMDNGEVKYGPTQDAYLDYLTTMRDWYAEGLIDPEYAMTDASTLTSKVTNELVGANYYLLAGGMGTWINMMGEENLDLVAMPWPSLEEGAPAYATSSDYNKVVVGPGVAFTKACLERGNLETAIRFRDYFYSPEGVIDSNFGILGESYTMVDGEAVFTDAVLNNDKGLTTTQALSQYALSASNDAMVKTAMYFKQVTLLLDNQKASQPVWNQCDISLLLPTLAHTAEESAFVAEKMNEINTYKKEMVMKFVLGEASLDEFETFVANIENLGIADVLECKQAAYDRYNNR